MLHSMAADNVAEFEDGTVIELKQLGHYINTPTAGRSMVRV